MISVSELIAKAKLYNPSINEALIQKAYILSKTRHGNQKRHSGDSYFSHPLAVAEILTDLKLDEESIITGLLHDLVEDTDTTLDEIEEEFGQEISSLVDGVTKLGRIESIPKNERVAENFRKLAIAMSQDIRVLLVKLADRLHNMRTLFYVPSREKKIKKARESLDIYAPLAGRIGLNKIKDEIQELAFEIIDPDTRAFISTRLAELKERKKDFIDKIIDDLEKKLSSEKIKFEVSGREKKPYSIWLKMKNRNVGFHHLNDIMAFRIVVSNVQNCYRALGIINSNYSMIPGTFKDYISTAKENGYRSLHLAVLGPLNKKIEIQIRDKKMHEVADLGVAAHWIYKEKRQKNFTKKESDQYGWIRDLITIFENSESATEALKHHRLEMHKDEVFCFTPSGDIFNLPIDSTPIDFAYAVHSEVGNSSVSAKINGMIAPLRQKLENGDQVEITTSKTASPSPNWLQFVATSKAKAEIKSFIRREKLKEHIFLGRTILKKFFAAKNIDFDEKAITKSAQKFNAKSLEDLYSKVAEGIVTRNDILKILHPNYDDGNVSKAFQPEAKRVKNHLLPIDGLVSGMAIHYGGCCNPIPGDAIVGVINTGTGVTIHNQFCHNLKNLALNPQRIIDVCWKSDKNQTGFYSSRIRVLLENKSGSLADITSVIAKKKVNILNIKIATRNIDYFELLIDLEISTVEHLQAVISSIRILKKVIEVQRIFDS
jgi:GTP pyrophosphokinase